MEREIEKIVVIGCGILGSQIAFLSAFLDYEVTVYDIDERALEGALENIRTVMKVSGRKSLLSMKDWEKGAEKIMVSRTMSDAFHGGDLVIEAVPEDLVLKRKIFRKMDGLAPQRAIFATNSSSIPISKIENTTKRPELCLNIHFYSLAAGVNMADIMGGERTRADTIETAKTWVRTLGCVPLTVEKETLGFCFNRIWRAVKREALHMWADGFVDFKDIDRGWMISYGTPWGPFGMMDRVGLDVVYDIEMVYYSETNNPKDHPPKALKEMVDRNELGIKTRKGFYIYPDPEYGRPDFLHP